MRCYNRMCKNIYMELIDLKDKDNDDKDILVGVFLINLKEKIKGMIFNFII